MLNKKKLYDTFTKVPTLNNTDSQLGGLRPQQNEGTKLDRTGHKVPQSHIPYLKIKEYQN